MHHHVLVIDDDTQVRECLAGALEETFEERVSVSQAKNGIDAIPAIKDGMVIFLDLEMPKMNGYEFLTWRCSNQCFLQTERHRLKSGRCRGGF